MTKNDNPVPASQTAAKPGKRYRGLLLFLLVCLLVSFAGSYLVFKFLVGSIPSELVGTWQVTDGPLKGGTLEFRSNGTAVAILERGGKKEMDDFEVKVEEKKIIMTTRDKITGKEDAVTQTILKLTQNELVIRDEGRQMYKMIRVRY